MKTFNDLKFKKHPNGNGLQATIFFPNGYGASIVRFKLPGGYYGNYTSNESEWELAILHGNEKAYQLSYNTPISDDVIGHLTQDRVTEILKQIQEL